MLSDLTIRHALASVCDVVFQRWRPKEILLISRYRWQGGVCSTIRTDPTTHPALWDLEGFRKNVMAFLPVFRIEVCKVITRKP